jgi:hypothetical protein
VKLLTTVDDSLEIQGRGCWILLAMWTSDLRLRQKDKIQLRRLGGEILNTYVDSIERAHGPVVGVRLTIGLPHGITKEEVPTGTEVWLDSQEKP